LRAALHQAGAAALTALLQFEAPATEQRQLAIGCGHHARYQEIRCRPILSPVPTTRAPDATPASFRWMSNWTSRTRHCLPGVHRMQATAGGRIEPSNNQYSITPLDKHEVGKKVDEKVRSNGEVGKPSFKKRERQGTQIRGWKLRVQSRRCRQSAYSWRKATRGSTRVARRAGM